MSVSRRGFMKAAGAGIAASVIPGVFQALAADPPRRRNVLYIFSDQQQRFALGCMGNPNVQTPNLDKLAAGGTLFQSCYSANPVCGPYRCSIFTGRFASATGCWNNGVRLPSDGRNLPEVLEANGVHTSWVGKWHIGGAGNKPIPAEVRGGFKDFIGYQCYNGFYKNVCFYDEEGREHRFDRHRTDVTTDLGIERLKKAASTNKPFAMFISYQAPHYPEQPAPEYEKLYTGKPMPKRPNYKPTLPYTATNDPPSPKPAENDPDYQRYGKDMDEYMRLYNALCTQIDAGVGRILETLNQLGLADSTLVFYSSDHGDMQGSHGLKNKTLPYEESAGIPLIVRAPKAAAEVAAGMVTGSVPSGATGSVPSGAMGSAAGRVCATPVCSVDMYPTILDWLGIAPRPEFALAGRSLAPFLAGGVPLPEIPVFSECNHSSQRWHMVRRGKFKLVSNRDKESKDLQPWLLFDLQSDPYEMNNLVESAEHAAERTTLAKLLTDFFPASTMKQK
ncbi:MAG: sulfatase-like hydrolase/transferase [Candidatus Sumerlaeota bacterium]|nr:sulfatase-like hydrolase/transferase [Candidatus Sumerlaeota bacterium]